MTSQDTIAAVATPPGRGGVAVIRISGPKVKSIGAQILEKFPQPRVALFSNFLANDGKVLDQGIALYFPAPHSFTGEDVLELQGHGGPVVVDMLLRRIIESGARLAKAGEFSERAFLNDKLDLTQAEAIADLIDASSTEAAQLAMRSLQGEFSTAINHLVEQLIALRVYIEAAIDFSDEEIDFLADDQLQQRLAQCQQEIATILANAQQGSILREGFTAVIAGEPNVGKSSLLNCLSGKQLAIVTDIAGTTRDILRDYILIDGIPMHIIDTAGLRDSVDLVEQEGIKRAYQEIENADLILYVLDATRDQAIDLPFAIEKRPIVFIRNKIDKLNELARIDSDDTNAVIHISVKQQLGIDLLKQFLKSKIGYQDGQGIYLARRRHLTAIEQAQSFLTSAVLQLQLKAPELAAEELRQAQLALNEITGQFTTDDLLGRIFSSFCIGK